MLQMALASLFPFWVISFPFFHFFAQRSLPKSDMLEAGGTIKIANEMDFAEVAKTHLATLTLPSAFGAVKLFLFVGEKVELHVH